LLHSDLPPALVLAMGRQLGLSLDVLAAFNTWLQAPEPVEQLFFVFREAMAALKDNESLAAVYALNHPQISQQTVTLSHDVLVTVIVKVGEPHVVVGVYSPVALASVDNKCRTKYRGMYSFFGFRGFDAAKIQEAITERPMEGFSFWDGSLFRRPKEKEMEWEKWAVEIRGRLAGTIPPCDSIEG